MPIQAHGAPMLARIRHFGALLTAYAGKVGRTAKLIGTWLTASADLLENLADLWGADGNNVHRKSPSSVEQIAVRARANQAGESKGQVGDGTHPSGAVHGGAGVLDSRKGVRGVQTEAEAPQEGRQDDTNGPANHSGTNETDSIGATA
jgi:hypothetical protein